MMIMNQDRRVLLKNVQLVDVKKNSIQDNVDILIEGEAIAAVGKFPTCICEEIINCEGLFAVPSLIDMHVHITFNSMVDGEMSLKNISLNLVQAAQNGVCIVRDVGMSPKWTIESVKSTLPEYPLPQVYFSGAPICVLGGHGSEYGTSIEISQVEEWVKSHKEMGYQWIKIMNDPENHSKNFLQKLVLCAHNYDIKVACHTFRKKGIKLAVDSGCDTIEHVVPIENLNELNCKPYYVPTMYSAWLSCRKECLNSISDEAAQYLIEWYELLKGHLSIAIYKGVKILCGTDAGCCPSSFGDIIPEMQILNMFGMSTIEVLQSATINAARCLNCDNKFGSIEVGKYANLFLVSGNPLNNLNHLNNRKIIFLSGVKIKDEVSVPWN